jgi:DNA-binding MarR family transcriptional regulator
MKDISAVTFVGEVLDMGRSNLATHDMNDWRGKPPDEYERHISSLILQLEELLAERPRVIPLPSGLAASRPPFPPPAPDDEPSDGEKPDPRSFPQGRALLARALIRQRRLRTDFLPATLFGEPAWDMLLDLYAAHYEGRPVSVSSLCIASSVPSTTALRAIEAMEREGCILRERDPSDGRRIFLKLSDVRRAELDAYFDRLGG